MNTRLAEYIARSSEPSHVELLRAAAGRWPEHAGNLMAADWWPDFQPGREGGCHVAALKDGVTVLLAVAPTRAGVLAAINAR